MPVWRPISPDPKDRGYLLTHLPPGQNDRHFTGDMFKRIFLKENISISNKISLKCVLWVNTQYVRIGSESGLVWSRRQAIIWGNADQVHWRIYAALRGEELIKVIRMSRKVGDLEDSERPMTFKILPTVFQFKTIRSDRKWKMYRSRWKYWQCSMVARRPLGVYEHIPQKVRRVVEWTIAATVADNLRHDYV